MNDNIQQKVNMFQAWAAATEDEAMVYKTIQRAIDKDSFTNPPGQRLPGSAVVAALRKLDPELVYRVLWPLG